ncbi:hypothetical protein ABT346_15520 [Micromonospora peucetia]|uniref:hypothetical protein n=1 Tax=Micromonospora peucetia TaxID=47871 RepID=UPI00331F88F1
MTDGAQGTTRTWRRTRRGTALVDGARMALFRTDRRFAIVNQPRRRDGLVEVRLRQEG